MKKCFNGCDAPVIPPSKVICKACQEKITRALEAELARLTGNAMGYNRDSILKEEQNKGK